MITKVMELPSHTQITILISLIIIYWTIKFILYIIGREIVCWYFKITRAVNAMESIANSLNIIANKASKLEESIDDLSESIDTKQI